MMSSGVPLVASNALRRFKLRDLAIVSFFALTLSGENRPSNLGHSFSVIVPAAPPVGELALS